MKFYPTKHLTLGLLIAFLSAGCAQGDAAPPTVAAPPATKAASVQTETTDPQVVAALAKLETHFDGVLPWLAQLYDPKSGGFFESIGARDDPKWGPDIQSTGMAVKLLEEGNLLDKMPDDIQAGLVRYFQSRQDKASGFFFDPDYPQFRDHERTRTRMLGFATRSLESLGAKPLYPLPGNAKADDEDGGGGEEMAAYVASKQAWLAWLQKRIGPKPGYWGRGTGSMDLLRSQTGLLEGLPAARRLELAQTARDYLAKTQDPQTGMWEGSVHAPLKLAGFLDAQGLTFPRADETYASTMRWYREFAPDQSYDIKSMGPVDTPRLGNPIRLLVYLRPQLSKPMSNADIVEVLNYYDRALPRFAHPDGGFSRFEKQFKIQPLDRPVADALAPQSDVNGTSNVRGARTAAYELARVEVPMLPHSDTFYALLHQRIKEAK